MTVSYSGITVDTVGDFLVYLHGLELTQRYVKAML